MNKISFYLFICVLSLTCPNTYAQVKNTPNTTASGQENNIFYHTIQRGETVYAIATMYGVTVDDIYRLNPESKDCIKIGFKLKIPQKKLLKASDENREEYTFHTIQPKETLYSLSVKYDVPADAILAVNPGLSIATFSTGKTIRIPNIKAEEKIIEHVKTISKDTEYTVKEKDTFYSIERRFDISKEQLIKRNPSLKQGLKAGMKIYVPEKFEIVVNTSQEAGYENEINALLDNKKEIQHVNVIKAALLLPFTNTADPARAPLYVEYYEGLLLAIDSLRNIGYSIDLSVYDTGSGTKELKEILKKETMKSMNLVIGGVQNDQISLITKFSQKNNIKYVIPFTSKNDDVLSDAYLFQVNTPHSYLYAKAVQAISSMFNDYNIIILKFAGDRDDKSDFIKTLKSELKQKHIAYKEVEYTDNFSTEIETSLSKDKQNIIIPTSGSSESLTKILTPLRMIADNKPEYSLSLFGYPEWQTYTKDFLEDFYALNTYIYSYFYADVLSKNVKDFYQKYKTWYSKNLINTYPKYGMLGFDTGLFFFTAIHNYGENFENSLQAIKFKNLQTGFNFERVNNWGGFINTNLFIIHYKKDFTVSKTELNQP